MPAVVVTGSIAEMIGGGVTPEGSQPAALHPAHHRRGPVAGRRPRDLLAVDASSAPRRRKPKPRKPRAEGAKPRVNIIGPIYGTFNMPSDLAEIRRLVEGIGCEINLAFPLGSHIEDIAQAARCRRQRLHVSRIRPQALRGTRPALSAGADRPVRHHELPAQAGRADRRRSRSRSSSARSTPRSSRSGICGAA